MKKICTIIFLSVITALTSSAMASRMYSCEGDGYDIAATLSPIDFDFDVIVERNGHGLDFFSTTVKEEDNMMSATAHGAMGVYTFSVPMPRNVDAVVNDQGVVDYGEITPTILELTNETGISTYDVECRVYDLTDLFFDTMFDGFPI